MNQSLYDAVFGCGEHKVDPFMAAKIDFAPIISDMRLCGYEITSLNVAEYIVLQQFDAMAKFKHQIISFAAEMDNRDSFCKEKYGVSFKDIDALDPKTDMEWDLKSGQVILFLSHESQYKEDAYMALFGDALHKFSEDTGFMYTRFGESI